MLTSAGCGDARLEKELKLHAPIGPGKSNGATLIQELLALNGINVAIDRDFGPATKAGLAAFCAKQGIPGVESVNQDLMDWLAQPLLRAILPVAPKATLGETIVAIGERHVREHPIEVGGANGGPWVRLYMRGNHGPDYLWCAGFVSYILAAAARVHGQPSPVKYTFSCDAIANEAKSRGKYKKKMSPADAPPGSIFIVPSATNAADWIHTGIIAGSTPAKTVFNTIEGNTNQGGSRNGFEACARIRACANVDVVLL
ncbi:MAG TPA: hypothetical protein VGB65_06710 [Allosphingosinicella sp.]|jgi:peptidoglycan hydrolase-like protein with peptidoglycan-binding domain